MSLVYRQSRARGPPCHLAGIVTETGFGRVAWQDRLQAWTSSPTADIASRRLGRFGDSDLLRRLFETVLQRCIDEGLVGGEGFAVDASLIQADASDRTRVEGVAGLPPDAAGRAVEEYLAVLDDAAFGAASEVTPKFIAPADPATRWTAAHRGPAFFAYSTNYLIDVDNAIIVDVEATTAIRQAEILAAKRMIERSLELFDLDPERLIGDTAYDSAEMLNWLVHDRGIEPLIPVFDKSQRTDGTFSREDFNYDHANDTYRCPAGKTLQHYRPEAHSEARSAPTTRAERRPRRVPPRRDRSEPPQARQADPHTVSGLTDVRQKAPHRPWPQPHLRPLRPFENRLLQRNRSEADVRYTRGAAVMMQHSRLAEPDDAIDLPSLSDADVGGLTPPFVGSARICRRIAAPS